VKQGLITRLQSWYKCNCDGDWEHSFGLNITNIDNPGWGVTIDLEDTSLEHAAFERSIDNGELDWMRIEVKDRKFIGHGDPNKLATIIEVFLDEFLPNCSDGGFQYDIYEPIPQNEKWFYKRLKGIIRSEDTFEVVEVPEFIYTDLRADNFDDLESLNFELLKETSKLKIGDIVKCDLKELADYPTVVVSG
jgi:hypothetical protein